jgi:hypothetical protein
MNLKQRANLVRLGLYVLSHNERLGVGLRNRCWGGMAVQEAMRRSTTVSALYGIPFSQLRTSIKKNNRQSPRLRNIVMGLDTVRLALRA